MVSGQRLAYEEQEETESEEDDNSIISTERSPSPTSSMELREELLPELQERFLSIVKEIDALYEIAVSIRNPHSRSRYKKVLSFKPPTDLETGVNILEQYAIFDIQHTRNFFLDQRATKISNSGMVQVEEKGTLGELDEILVMRLAQAITQRRRQFMYWKSHRDKLAREATDQHPQRESDPSVLRKDMAKPNEKPTPSADAFRYDTKTERLAEDSESINQKQSAIHTDTTATKFFPSIANAEREYPESATSFATSARGNDTVDFPPPPKYPAHGYFECPYCYTICPESYREHKEWK